MKKKFLARALGASTMLLAAAAVQAAPLAAVDVTDVTGTISNQLTSMGAIQLGLLSAIGLLIGYRLIRRAMS